MHRLDDPDHNEFRAAADHLDARMRRALNEFPIRFESHLLFAIDGNIDLAELDDARLLQVSIALQMLGNDDRREWYLVAARLAVTEELKVRGLPH